MRTLICLAFVACFGLHGQAALASSTKKYKGAWFEVRYPSTFKARKSLDDSAFFLAPDKSVEFYIFSPQWNGDPTDYAFNPNREKMTAHSDKTVKKGGNSIHVLMETVTAKDGSYTRSWVSTENMTLNVRLVFGIKYRDQRAYAANKAKYEAFKKSLQQFSD